VFKSLVARFPGINFLKGGWPDEARFIIQAPVFRELLREFELGGECLDAGCGEGLFVRFLDGFRKFDRIVHVDLQKPEADRFQLDSRHEIAAGSIVDLPFNDGSFDFVFCTEVLEHVEDDARAFSEISRVLKANGLALLSTPTPPAPADPEHVREGYTLIELQERCSTAGLKVLKYEYCFRFAMRLLLRIWRWQYELSGETKSRLPRAAVITLAHFDRWFPIGKPFDIVVVAQKMSSKNPQTLQPPME
jgi:SAM-dependent methyltransferase